MTKPEIKLIALTLCAVRPITVGDQYARYKMVQWLKTVRALDAVFVKTQRPFDSAAFLMECGVEKENCDDRN